MKDKTKDEYKHDLIYYGKCPECDEGYVGEAGKRLQDRVMNIREKIVSLTF